MPFKHKPRKNVQWSAMLFNPSLMSSPGCKTLTLKMMPLDIILTLLQEIITASSEGILMV